MDNGHSFDAVFGYNDQNSNFIRDFDVSGFSNAYTRDPQSIMDLSAEVRASSPQDQRLRWTIGFNYYEQEFTSDLAGGDAAFACVDTRHIPAADRIGLRTRWALGFPK